MADLKISQLPELTTTPSPDSEIIVNDASAGDYVTKRVAMGNLLGGVSVFEPQKVLMSQGANGTGESVINYSTRQWAQRSPFVVGSSATQSATLPDGATHALIVWTTFNSWRSDIPQVPTDSSPIRHWRQYVAHRLNLTGGTYINNP